VILFKRVKEKEENYLLTYKSFPHEETPALAKAILLTRSGIGNGY
jgi:hypothetical protein